VPNEELRVVPAGGGGPARVSRRGFGHTPDRRGIVEAEATAIREAARRVLDGETLSSVVQEWNRRGVRTANGGPWRVNSLSSILVQPRLAGLAGEAAAGTPPAFPPIIDLETHQALLALHASRSKGPRRATRHYLLTGLLRCWRCGGGLRGMPRSRGADLYVCPGPPHGGCSGTAVTADHADEAVLDMVLARLDSPELLGGGGPSAPAPPAAPAARRVPDANDHAGRLAAHRGKLADLADMWADGDITREEWVSLKRTLGGRARAVEAELGRLDRVEALRRLAGSGGAIRAAWATMSVDQRRKVLHTAVDHVVVLQAEPPRQVFRPERLQPVWMG
jgi:site-specific DNA recombinase